MAKKKNETTEATQENKTTKVSAKMISEQIQSIKSATETIKVAIEQMPECGAKKSFGLTLANLEKKLSKYNKVQGEILTDDEKEILRKFRAGEISA